MHMWYIHRKNLEDYAKNFVLVAGEWQIRGGCFYLLLNFSVTG